AAAASVKNTSTTPNNRSAVFAEPTSFMELPEQRILFCARLYAQAANLPQQSEVLAPSSGHTTARMDSQPPSTPRHPHRAPPAAAPAPTRPPSQRPASQTPPAAEQSARAAHPHRCVALPESTPRQDPQT